jgi:phenylpropionate dioxygenase-like ring-hydroxylating dioxygenase large terminal subunit
MYNKNYLAKRPFLIITNRFKPSRGSQTQQKGWAAKTGWEVHEEVQIVDRVTAKHQNFATAIIDVMEAKVVKNGFVGSDRDEIMTHFMTKYKAQLTEAIDIWMSRLARDKVLGELKNPLKDDEAEVVEFTEAVDAEVAPEQQNAAV